jgi:sugar phosphate isomerase/epimerase
MKGFCQLGEGRGRYQECIDALNEIGFDGWYITENFYHIPPMGNTGSVFVTAAKDLETMRKI